MDVSSPSSDKTIMWYRRRIVVEWSYNPRSQSKKPLKLSELNDCGETKWTWAGYLKDMIISRFEYVYPFFKFVSNNLLWFARAKSYGDVNSDILMYQLWWNVKLIPRIVTGVNGSQGLSLDMMIIEGWSLLRGSKYNWQPFDTRSDIRYPSITLKPLIAIICAIVLAVFRHRDIITLNILL